MRLALAQINSTVGDIRGNVKKITDRLDEAKGLGADLVVFPEMAVTGYPPEDLLLKPDFVKAAIRALGDIAPFTAGVTAVVGGIMTEGDLFNSAIVFHDGKKVSVFYKHFLPNYGVFDENRYFQVFSRNGIFVRDGIPIGVSICEDMWYADGPASRQVVMGGAELLINVSASPYHFGKGMFRERMFSVRASDHNAFTAMCNMVGGQDELIFDGHSVVCNPQGETIARAAQFVEELLVVDIDFRDVFRRRLQDPRQRKSPMGDRTGFETVTLDPLKANGNRTAVSRQIFALLPPVEEVYRALTLGTGDYVRKNGFQKVVIGLSGGIDSSLTAAVAADALGAENVIGVAMPTRYSSGHSLEDAERLAGNLGIRLMTVPIDGTFQAFLDMLAPSFKDTEEGVAEENIQPRIRGTLLMALSNKFGWLVLTTGNKSEVGVGYSTLYGDTAGGFAVIKDVPKTLVYKLCRYRNEKAGYDLIPQRVLDKPPSAELRPDQKDTDSLPEYDVLDRIIEAYVETGKSIDEIADMGIDRKVLKEVIRKIDINEYKRRQSPPGVRITPRAFGKDWRLPITNRYREGGSL